MKFSGKRIFKMVLRSMWKTPEEWTLDSHGKTGIFRSVYWAENEELDIKVWCANGLPFFEFQQLNYHKNGLFPFFGGPKVSMGVLHSIILHIVYLRKLRKYPYLAILFRYLLIGVVLVGVGTLVNILLLFINNYQNSKEIELDISKSEVLDRKLEQILDK